MGLKEWIVPQDRAFFRWLDEAASNAHACALALQELLTHFGDIAARRQQVKDLEHKGDSISHEIFDALSRTFVTPLDREDIGALTKSFDDIVDFMYAAVNRIHLYGISQPTDAMRRLADLLVAQTQELAAALQEIRSPRTRQKVLARAIEINRLENQADRLLNESVADLFRGTDPIHIMKHKEVLEMLETATDKCEDVADVLSDIVRKQG